MKLWHDDIRRPPDDSWTWVRTNYAARVHLATGRVDEASLDHDMGLEQDDPDAPGADLRIGQAEANGLDLVRWMCTTGFVPPKVTLHSMNPVGAKAMARALLRWAEDNDRPCRITIRPFSR